MKRLGTRAVVSLLVLALAAVVVSGQRYVTGEVAIVEAAVAVPGWVGIPFRVVMQLGTLWVGLGVMAVLIALSQRLGWQPAAALALSITVAFRADNVLKAIIERPRPSAVIDGIQVREHIGGFGFPSGHTTMAVAIVAALNPVLPTRWRVVTWAAMAVTAITRMHVAAHWPMDLVGGFALGLAIASLAWLVVAAVSRDRSVTVAGGH